MRVSVRVILAIAVLAASLVPAQAQTKLTLGYGSASAWIASFVAADQGIFAKHDLDVTMRFVPSAATQPAAITAGSLDVGTFNAPLLLLADEGGLDLQIVAGGTSEQGKDKEMGRVMARAESGIKSAQDFRGRRIEAVAMATDLPIYSPAVTAAEVQLWIDACKDLGVTKGTLTVNDVLAK